MTTRCVTLLAIAASVVIPFSAGTGSKLDALNKTFARSNLRGAASHSRHLGGGCSEAFEDGTIFDGRHGLDIRVVAPVWYGWNLDELYQLVDQFAGTGANVFGINAVYTDWETGAYGGLTLGDMATPADIFGGDFSKFQDFVQYAHGKCMKVISWWNPSYVRQDTGYYENSDYFNWIDEAQEPGEDHCSQQNVPPPGFNNDCEQIDLGGYTCCDVFEGQGCVSPYDDDGKPNLDIISCISKITKTSWCKWIYEPSKGQCYQSVWANLPSASFRPETGWKDVVLDAMSNFMNAGLDGFILDAPDRYVDIDEDGDLLWNILVSEMRAKWPNALILGEVYYQANPVWLPRWQGIDGGITVWDEGDLGVSNNPLFDAIHTSDVSKVDCWDNGAKCNDWRRNFLGQDAAINMCYLSTSRDGSCPRAWLRFAPSIDDQWYAGNALARAISAAGGYITVIENVVDVEFWGGSNWPGDDDETSVDFIKFLTWTGNIGAYKPMSLRSPGFSNGESDENAPVYSMIRYDAFDTGLVAIVVGNLGSNDGVHYDASWAIGGNPKLQELLQIEEGGITWELTPYQFAYTTDQIKGKLPTWRNEAKGDIANTRCTDSQGSFGEELLSVVGTEEMTLGTCLLLCLGYAPDDPNTKCYGVNVFWNQNDYPNGVGDDKSSTPDLIASCRGLLEEDANWICDELEGNTVLSIDQNSW
jgi:hypothetical protein